MKIASIYSGLTYKKLYSSLRFQMFHGLWRTIGTGISEQCRWRFKVARSVNRTTKQTTDFRCRYSVKIPLR